MSEEEWRAVPGYEGIYEVSSLGRVKSLPRWHVRQERISLGGLDSGGYRGFTLRKDGEGRRARVHELVLLAFVGPRPSGADLVRHLNGIPSDNRLENIRYGTFSENQHDAVSHGTHAEMLKTHCPSGHPYDAANTYVSPLRRRSCRTCNNESTNRRRAEQRAAAARVA